MRSKLSEAELFELQNMVEDDVRFLFRREGEEEERLFRLRYPSHEQRLAAEQLRQTYLWTLRKNPDLKSQSQVEEEYKSELADLRKRQATLRSKCEDIEYEFTEKLPEFPDKDSVPEAFEKELAKQSREIKELNQEQAKVGVEISAILSSSVEYLARQRYVAVLAALCWEEPGDDGEWVNVWNSWEEFKEDRTSLATFLEGEAVLMFMPSPAFFASLPSLLGGGSASSTLKTVLDSSSQEQ